MPYLFTTHISVLERIVSNYLSNALKFSKPGSSVQMDLERTDREVIISVTDEGPGIPEHHRANIFSGQIRTHAARPTGGESSTGMELYQTGEPALRLGAKLTCDATLTGGTVFAVRIPASDKIGDSPSKN